MSDLTKIQESVAAGAYQYTLHAVRRATERHTSRAEVEQAIANAEIIEHYPEDKYGPSCLLYGQTDAGRHVHVQASFPPPLVKIITVYEPDPEKWEDYRVRKSNE